MKDIIHHLIRQGPQWIISIGIIIGLVSNKIDQMTFMYMGLILAGVKGAETLFSRRHGDVRGEYQSKR